MEQAEVDRFRGALAPRYEVVREIGRGGMATVLEAMDVRHGRAVAIKVIAPELSPVAGVERFLREIEVLAKLQHRGIVPLFDSGVAEGLPYLVMPLVRGESLRALLDRERQLSVDATMKIAVELADALEYAHEHGVVHRDLKPGNVLIENGYAVLADFGLASALGASDDERLTRTGFSVGTPLYMSPEQASSERVDARSDVYSLGCVVYEMLAGAPPFTGVTAEIVLRQHLTVEPRPISAIRPGVPPHVVVALNRALAKSPADRFPSAAAFAAALQDGSGRAHAPEPEADTVTVETVRPARSSRGPFSMPRGVLAVLLVAVLAGLAGWGAMLLRGSSRAAHADGAPRQPILVAEFEGPAADQELRAAARQFVSASLDQSDWLECVPHDQIRQALQLAGRPDTSRLDNLVARELAFRNGIPVTLEGRVDRLGDAFGLILVARESERGAVLATVTGQAKGERDLLGALGRMSARLRGKLGERPDLLTLSGPRWLAATPSFDAYRKYSAAFEMQQMRGDDRGSIELLDQALSIDPDFAEAWALKMFAYSHLGESDSARRAMNEALRRPERMTDDGRMFIEGLRDAERGNFGLAEAKYRELIRRGYQLSSSLGNYGSILWSAGRYGEALQQYQQASRASRFGPQQWVASSEVDLLLLFDRVDEARAQARHLQGSYADEAALGLEVVAENWERAESLAVEFEQNPIRDPQAKTAAAQVLAALRIGRGELAKGSAMLGPFPAMRLACEIASRSCGIPASASVGLAFDPDAPLVTGLACAARGEIEGARKALQVLRHADGDALHSRQSDVAILDACIRGANGDWPGAAAALAAEAAGGEREGPSLSPPLRRWLAADAYDRAGVPDSALVGFERVTRPETLLWRSRLMTKLLTPFARLRMARIHAERGDVQAARTDRDASSAMLTRSDPSWREALRTVDLEVANAGRRHSTQER